MISWKRGSLTVALSLAVSLILSICLIFIEGCRNYFLGVEAAAAMELAEFSILSEYQQELFLKYGVFLLDLDYEQGEEELFLKLRDSPRVFKRL